MLIIPPDVTLEELINIINELIGRVEELEARLSSIKG